MRASLSFAAQRANSAIMAVVVGALPSNRKVDTAVRLGEMQFGAFAERAKSAAIHFAKAGDYRRQRQA